MYVEDKFGLRIRDFKPSEMSLRESSDSTDFDVVSSLLSGKGKWSSDSRGENFKGDTAHFQQDCNASKHMGKQKSGKGNQSKSMSELSISGKGKVKRPMENPKESPKHPKVPKVQAKV